MKRLEKARGIIIAGEPGSGKSTFVQALAEFYSNSGFIVKTVESPRDLQLPEQITQYSKNFASSSDIHDILFLSRPDYVIFDEMRDTPDFILYTDLRLGGSECIGVLHSASPIDAIQRFIGRLEVGMIPSIVDTVLFIKGGQIDTLLSLALKVKVPSGMTESDLVRPVIEIRDFVSNKLYYEIYKYGEETVVVNISKEKSDGDSVERIEFDFTETKKDIFLSASPGRYMLFIGERPITKIRISGERARFRKRSKLGSLIFRALKGGKNISLR